MSREKDFQNTVMELVKQYLECSSESGFKVVAEYESPHGSAIRNQGRRVDIAVLKDNKPYLFIECKWQETSGSTQDKIFRALEEVKRDHTLGVHSIVVFGGHGWSKSIERWAIAEGMIREEWIEKWLERFFCRGK